MVVIGNAILLVAYGLSLCKMRRGTRYELFMNLIVLLMIACVASAGLTTSNYAIVKGLQKDPPDKELLVPLIISAAVCLFFFAACFDVAHWLFAFEYFTIAKLMPLAQKGLAIPQDQLKRY
jgi:hypothetical protein